MDAVTLENLLNESESNYLDFKQEQYQFEGASEEEKSEMLKDILAFANAWRRTDAYILLGVKEVKGGRSQIIGITTHIDDAAIQQFVNSKVQKPIHFSYATFESEEKQIGIIKIPVQDRPFYIKQKYGKVMPNVVYIRRGSSTDVAKPDEIAKMGTALASDNQNQVSGIDFEFANPDARTLYGKEIDVTSTILHVNEPILNFSPNPDSILSLSGSSPNRKYYQELYKLYDYSYLLFPVSFRLSNLGGVTAYNARIEINTALEDLLFVSSDDFPEQPQKYFSFFAPINAPSITQNRSRLSIEKNGAGWWIRIRFGNIQPKAEDWLEEPIYMGSRKPQDIQFDAIIYADNAPNPIHAPLCIHFHTDEVTKTLKELEIEQELEFKKEMDELYPDEE